MVMEHAVSDTSFECVCVCVLTHKETHAHTHTHTYVALVLHPNCVPEKVGVSQKGLYQTQHSKN